MTPEELAQKKDQKREEFKRHIWAAWLTRLPDGDVDWWVRSENGDAYKRLTGDAAQQSMDEWKQFLADFDKRHNIYPQMEGE